MAFEGFPLVLTTSEQNIVEVDAGRQAIARFTITNNHGSSARTYTLKHYKAATATTVTLRNAFNINALSAVDIPAITMSEGDKIIALASANSDVAISGSFHDTAKAIPFAVAGIDGVDPGYPWNFRDKTDVEEPDAVGDLNFNNSVLADVTKIALSAQSSGAGNPDLSDIIESWDDNGESANRGRLLLKNRNAPAQTAEFRLTGTVTYHDATIDWYELDVEFIGGPGLSTDAELSVQFFDAGEEGAAGVSGASAMTKVDVVDTDDGDPDTDYEDGDEIDGVTLEANMLVLRASSSDPELNGVYVVPVSGAASRHSDFDDFDDLPGSEFNALSGDTYGGSKWRCFSEKGGVIDTDSVTINQVTSMDGTQNLSDVADAPTAFNNIKQGATTAYAGVVELADNTETQAGTDTGRAVTPAGLRSATRARLTSNTTFYVRTDGSDSNDGLANSSGGAFLTLQAAWDHICTYYDLAGYTATISVQSGTYTAGVIATLAPVGGLINIVGTSATVNATGHAFSLMVPTAVTVSGFAVTTASSGSAFHAGRAGATLTIGSGNTIGATASWKVLAQHGGEIAGSSALTVSGNSTGLLGAAIHGHIRLSSMTLTISGTPTWGFAGIGFFIGAVIDLNTVTFSGSATGQRYSGSSVSVLDSKGAGTASTYFPGSTDGTVVSGAVQV